MQQETELSNIVTQQLTKNRLPAKKQILAELGQNDKFAEAVYLNIALLHQSGKSMRRDSKGASRHAYDAAYRPKYRFSDPKNPTKYTLSEPETICTLLHDIGEDVGKTLIGAMVFNDMQSHLFGNGHTLKKNLELITNYRDFIWGPVKSGLKKRTAQKPLWRSADMHTVLKQLRFVLDRVPNKVKKEDIMLDYARFRWCIHSFKNGIERLHSHGFYDHQRPVIKYVDLHIDDFFEAIDVIDGLMDRFDEVLDAGYIVTPEQVVEKYGVVRDQISDVLGKEEFLYPDEKLMFPGESHAILTLDKTLYYAYLSDIYSAALQDAEDARYPVDDDSFLGAMMPKIAENADNVLDISKDPSHMESIYRKSRGLLRAGANLYQTLQNRGASSLRLGYAVQHLYKSLQISVTDALSVAKIDLKRDTAYRPTYQRVELMREKLKDLKPLINKMKVI